MKRLFFTDGGDEETLPEKPAAEGTETMEYGPSYDGEDDDRMEYM